MHLVNLAARKVFFLSFSRLLELFHGLLHNERIAEGHIDHWASNGVERSVLWPLLAGGDSELRGFAPGYWIVQVRAAILQTLAVDRLDCDLGGITSWALLVLTIVHGVRLGLALVVWRLSSSTFLLLLLFAFFHGLSEYICGNDPTKRWIIHSEEVAHRR